jgi:hypothetical protein
MLFQIPYTPENFLFTCGNGAGHDRFGGSKQAFTMLACDLMHFHEPGAKYRRLSEAICLSGDDRAELTTSRRQWLKKVEAKSTHTARYSVLKAPRGASSARSGSSPEFGLH